MHLVTTVTLLCVALAARADGSAVQSPAIDASDSLCRSLDTACANLWISIQCKVTKSCVPRWELTDSSAVGNDTELCALCKKMVKQARHQLLTNETQSEIRQVVDGSCDIFLPVTPLNTLCKKLMNLFVDELNDVLVSRMNPTQVCSICGLCWASTKKAGLFDRVSYVTLSKEHEEAKCNACKNTIRRAVSFAELIPQDKVVDGFMKICEVESGNRKQQCEQFAQIYVDKLFEAVKKDTPERSCQALEQCPGDMLPTSNFVNLRPYGDVQCEFCEAMLHQLIVQFNNTTTKLQVKAVLEGICRDTGSLAKECLDQVTKNFDVAYDGLLNFLNSPVVCRLLGLCSASAKFEVTATTDSLPMARLTSAISRQNSQKCSMCQIMVNIIEFGLRNNNSRHEIEIFLNKVCSALSTDEQATCRTMIDVYTSYIIQMIENLISSKEICQALTFCPRQAINIKCEICIFILNLVEDQLGNNQTESEILEVLDKSCDLLSPQNVSECRFIVKQFVDMTITLLVQNAPPRKICEEVRQCPKALQPVKNIASISAAPLQRPDEKCSLCKWLITWVDDKLKENHTEAIIKEELDKACDLLNDSTECKEMANSYVDMIVKMLVQYVDPEQICETLGKCPKKAVLSSRVEPPCQLCKYYVHELRDRLNSSNAEAEIKSGLDQICAALSVDGKECTDLVDRYTHLLIRVILENTDLEVVCRTLKVCPTKITIRPTATNCDYCQKIVNFISMEVKNEDNDEKIIEVIEKVCDYVPIQYQEDCHRMVEIDGMVIFRMIAESVDPDIICAAIKLCSTNGPDLVCTLCEYSLHYIQEKLYDNATQAEIRSELDKMCAKLKNPGMASDCKEFIDVYGSALEVIIAQKLDPSIICPTIHACPSSRGIRTGRRPSTARCHDCMSLTNANPLGYQSICVDMKSLSLHKCENAAMAGEIGGSNLTICKLIKACYAEQADKGSFTCTSRGCKYTA